MIYLAELNKENVCFSIKMALEYIDDGKHVEIDSLNYDLLNRKYENGQWSEEKYSPPEEPQDETIEEKLNRLEQQIQNDNLIIFDVLATIHEEQLLRGSE